MSENKQLPSSGNGGTTDKYVWTQTLVEVNIVIPFDSAKFSNLTKKDIKVVFGKSSLDVSIRQERYIHGDFFNAIKPDDCFWQLDTSVDSQTKQTKQSLTLYLEKLKKDEWWSCVLKGDAEIDATKAEPETSKLQDLDDETRSMVEKMMLEQRTKAVLNHKLQEEKERAARRREEKGRSGDNSDSDEGDEKFQLPKSA
eukprot:CAMPEP_0184697404 /NCGR_PEP_ID=MMETSP0313-20130426/4381_1 /TAXON_ID=2792 /ORGANISM="Porphyridium aerugineum, Strain SAG 1380-2" /LENGTH=197 /DNA_ID=CAMNT_0027156191 /DNA_START=35 /DNA_END=624 /DNA_ORIENTATION=+